jgi:hypothetical protein
MDDAFAVADRFLLDQARLLERRLFATCFLGQQAATVLMPARPQLPTTRADLR